ncbi:MAG: hypothetical protein LBN20_02730 [Endomicrobium sp.]|jgi:hypothetical protein|nr:hypothetical protein [Endomicrobium sp.]
MSKKAFTLSFVLLIALVAIAVTLYKIQDNKNSPLEQVLNKSKITITAPPFTRSLSNEEKLKKNPNDKIKEVHFYKSKYKDANYTLIFAQYLKEPILDSVAKSIQLSLKDNNLILTSTKNKIDGFEGIYLEGSFEKDNKKYALKNQVIKDKLNLWQVLVIYPQSEKSEKNDILSDKYISSIEIENPNNKTDDDDETN